MTAQKGREVLIKIGDGADPEVFTAIGGMITDTFAINNTTVDVTTKGDAGTRQLLEGAGVKTVSLSGNGYFTDSATEETLRVHATANTHPNLEFVMPNGDKYAGAFQVTSYERAGDEAAAETFSVSFESAGTVTYTAA